MPILMLPKRQVDGYTPGLEDHLRSTPFQPLSKVLLDSQGENVRRDIFPSYGGEKFLGPTVYGTDVTPGSAI